jgi:hypothetical protein
MPGALFDVPSPRERGASRYAVSIALNREGKIAGIYVVSATPKLSAIR